MKESFLGKVLSKLPYIRYAYFYRRYCQYRPGHFYSPVVNLDELEKNRDRIWKKNRNLTGINLNEERQYAFIDSLMEASKIIPFTDNPASSNYRYYSDNKTYAYADGLVLFASLLKYRPKRVVEVGSGFSSGLMLDTNDKFLNGSVHFTFIEPNPGISLNKVLRK